MNGAQGCIHALFMRPRACSWRMSWPPYPPAVPGAGLCRRAAAAILCGLCCGLVTFPLAAVAARDDGQRVQAAREQGRIVPLEQLIAQVAASIPGRLLAAELEEDDGVLVYELKWQLADGRRLEIELDARDGRWLKLEGPRLESVFKPLARPGR